MLLQAHDSRSACSSLQVCNPSPSLHQSRCGLRLRWYAYPYFHDETMLIEFRCGNYSAFDAATGKHTVCGQKMSAAAEDSGLIVTCPKCHQDCEVPQRQSNRTSGSGGSPAAATETKTPLATKRRSPNNRCPNCGGRINNRGACGSCRWVKPKHQKLEQSLDEMEMEPAGMMLWFSNIISEGVPPKVFCLAAIVGLSLIHI